MRPVLRFNLLFCLIALVLMSSCRTTPAADIEEGLLPLEVATTDGTFLGATSDDGAVRIFKGIPFAQPPVGELRWWNPQPPLAFEGSREALEFSPACEQTKRSPDSFYGPGAEQTSEDCLYLNLWTAAADASEHRPTMVWIHGGSLRNGHGGLPTYDGESFARKGVVLVTVNYRLGPFGFLAHPLLSAENGNGHSGNYGFLDQIAALQWVKQNIASFGGDPNQVTIFGESAGSLSVSFLQASPLAQGLFHGVIAESGSALRNTTSLAGPNGAEAAGERLVAALLEEGQEPTLESMRAAPPEQVLAAVGKEGVNFPSTGVVDGSFLVEPVWQTFSSGGQNDVPVMIGWNRDEGPSLAGSRGPKTLAELQGFARASYGELAESYFELYPATTDEEARAGYLDSFGVSVFGWGAREWARLMSTVSSDAWLYYFERVPPGELSQEYGAYHAAEIQYVFGNLDSSDRPWEAIDRELSEQMLDVWVSFATDGDPNGPGLAEWPAWTPENKASFVFGDVSEVRTANREPELDFMDRAVKAARDR